MAQGTLAPVLRETVLDTNGKPVAGALINTYIAGTTTPLATFTDVGLTTPNANPIVADAAGRWYAYLTVGQSYKFVVTDSLGGMIYTQDSVLAVPSSSLNVDVTGTAGATLTAGQVVYLSDGLGSRVAGLWYPADSANTYSSTVSANGVNIIIGMVPNTIQSGGSGTIRQAGSVSGLTSLTVGSNYYVGTAGALTTSVLANNRFVGIADTTSSIIIHPNPVLAIQQAQVALTGSYAAPTTNQLLVGNGTNYTNALLNFTQAETALTGAATAPTNGQLLVGNATNFTLATLSAGSGISVTNGAGSITVANTRLNLLHQGSGTDTSAGATTVDSFTVAGLTVKDTIFIFYSLESITQATANVILDQTTDPVTIVSLSAGASISAGVTIIGHAQIMARQGSTTQLQAIGEGLNSSSARIDAWNNPGFTTLWTANWGLGLRHGGVTSGGTFKYVWSVYSVTGE